MNNIEPSSPSCRRRIFTRAPVHPGRRTHLSPQKWSVGVLCAGTADLPVAEEAAVCLESFGRTVDRVNDVGVAGLHRLLGEVERVRSHGVLIVWPEWKAPCPAWSPAGSPSRHRRSHQRGVWSEFLRPRRAARHAQQLRQRRDRDEYRQRLRRACAADDILRLGENNKPAGSCADDSLALDRASVAEAKLAGRGRTRRNEGPRSNRHLALEHGVNGEAIVFDGGECRPPGSLSPP